jgi:hypothetical protein
MSKYIRHQSVVSRHIDENIDGDHWLKQFTDKLQKSAVQPRETDQSLFDQINSIMNNKHSKYSSVEDAVEEMKARSGLTAYLEKDFSKISKEEDTNKKTASKQHEGHNNLPTVIIKCPQIKNTLENYIKDTKGNLPIPAIIDKIKSIHHVDVSEAKDWDDEKLLHLVSKLNLNAKKDNPGVFQNYQNLGLREDVNNSEIDPSNVDAFHALNPVKF